MTHFEDNVESCQEASTDVAVEVTGHPNLVTCMSCKKQLQTPQQVSDTDILTWLQGRCIFLDVVSGQGVRGQDTTIWHAEDGISIADAVIAYCDQNNIDLLAEIASGCVETPHENQH